MIKHPFMPLPVAEFMAESGLLTSAELGVYIRLLCFYWARGGLPTDDAGLARVARVGYRDWKHYRPAIEPLFTQPGWRHERLDAELERVNALREKLAKGGRERWKTRAQESVDKNQLNLLKTNGSTLAEHEHSDSYTEESLGSPKGKPRALLSRASSESAGAALPAAALEAAQPSAPRLEEARKAKPRKGDLTTPESEQAWLERQRARLAGRRA